jgi:hypothetical protein
LDLVEHRARHRHALEIGEEVHGIDKDEDGDLDALAPQCAGKSGSGL